MTRIKLWLAAAVVLAAFLPALAEARAWSTDGIFSLIPPAGWKVDKPARNSLHFSQGQAALDIECESQLVPIKDEAFREKVKASVDPRFTVKSEADAVLSGMPAIQCELDGVADFKDYAGRFVVMTDATTKRTWFITYSAPRAASAEAFGAIEESLGTLQLR